MSSHTVPVSIELEVPMNTETLEQAREETAIEIEDWLLSMQSHGYIGNFSVDVGNPSNSYLKIRSNSYGKSVDALECVLMALGTSSLGAEREQKNFRMAIGRNLVRNNPDKVKSLANREDVTFPEYLWEAMPDEYLDG